MPLPADPETEPSEARSADGRVRALLETIASSEGLSEGAREVLRRLGQAEADLATADASELLTLLEEALE